jgi:hypothetical protein
MSMGMANSKPKKNQEVAEKIGATTMLFDSSVGRLFELNETGKAIWSMCDGSRTVEEIAKVMVSEYGIEPAKAADDTSAFITKMRELNLIQS